MSILFLFPVLFVLCSLNLNAQNPYNSTLEDTASMRKMIVFLSSDRLKGREVGTHGSLLASRYIAEMMDKAGIKPDGDQTHLKSQSSRSGKRWFQNFTIVRYPAGKTDSLSLPAGESESDYSDGNYFLPGDTIVDPSKTKIDTLEARNILGIIRGQDTTKEIIIGAHYDHLGERNGSIYPGADDNASGVAGVLALARYWSHQPELPACNLVIAAWTAEEKGQIGSRYYTIDRRPDPKNTIVVFNLDMIAGNAPEDTAMNQLSIGTRTMDNYLRSIAIAANQNQEKGFELDLWDVTGHSGSDYKYFSESGVPVMTFFSGFLDGYHTPDDTASRIDLSKMKRILSLVNECINSCLKLNSK